MNVDGEPGVTGQALNALQKKVQEKAKEGKELCACLLMDEMAVRQQVTWNEQTQQFDGTVNHGGLTSCVQNVVPAKEALVFMLSGVDEAWKVPIAYFLISGLKAENKKEIVNTVLYNLQEVGVKVIAFTFDGTVSNIATANALGCDLHTDSDLKTSFTHPCGTHEVHVLLDVVHMMKLVRNTLHSQRVLNSETGTVKWEYIVKLNAYQNEKGLKLAKNLTDKHVHFENSKMKVILAVQTLSNGVASALDILSSRNADFKDCGPTATFLRTFNNLFDVLNSMEADSRGFKRPLSRDNFKKAKALFESSKQYIHSLKLIDGTPILSSKNKTGFLGFIVAMESFCAIFSEYCQNQTILPALFTYRFSQDHLEMFFGAIRSKSGSNNNPNANQFRASYKRMLKQVDISNSVYANCTDFNVTPLMDCYSNTSSIERHEASQYSDEYQYQESPEEWDTFCNDDITDVAVRSLAEQVIKKISSKIVCQQCYELVSIIDAIVLICKSADFEFRV